MSNQDNSGHVTNMHNQERKPADIKVISEDGTYVIRIVIDSVASTEELRDTLQAAYDEGAAGTFDIKSVEGSSSTRQIEFSRDLGDDFEMLAERIKTGRPIRDAAREQLADEFEEFQATVDGLSVVIEPLRTSLNSEVSGFVLDHEEANLDDECTSEDSGAARTQGWNLFEARVERSDVLLVETMRRS